jgi:hypothetical protein
VLILEDRTRAHQTQARNAQVPLPQAPYTLPDVLIEARYVYAVLPRPKYACQPLARTSSHGCYCETSAAMAQASYQAWLVPDYERELLCASEMRLWFQTRPGVRDNVSNTGRSSFGNRTNLDEYELYDLTIAPSRSPISRIPDKRQRPVAHAAGADAPDTGRAVWREAPPA